MFILKSFRGKRSDLSRAPRQRRGVVAVRLGVHELIAAYCDCIDEDRLEEWPDPCR